MFFPFQLNEAGNLTLLNLVTDGKLVVDGKLLQEEEYQRKYKPSDPLLRKLGFKANPTLAISKQCYQLSRSCSGPTATGSSS